MLYLNTGYIFSYPSFRFSRFLIPFPKTNMKTNPTSNRKSWLDFPATFKPPNPVQSDPASHYYVDAEQWMLAPMYAALGNLKVHAHQIHGAMDMRKLVFAYSGHIVRSQFNDVLGELEDGDTDPGYHGMLLYFKKADTWVTVYSHCLTVFSSSPNKAASLGNKLANICRPEQPKGARMFILSRQYGSLYAEEFHLESGAFLQDERMKLHYGDAFPSWHARYLDKFQGQAFGISIFDGPPGTGKTSYIRHLAWCLKDTHRFHFLPGAPIHALKDPEFMEFWAEERRKHKEAQFVVVLEDAEALLLPRDTGSDSVEAVSVLLNLTDGLLGNYLRLHIIATMNGRCSQIDPALRRPGRLVGHRTFGLLDLKAAQRLSWKLGKPLARSSEKEAYSLAEVYNGEALDAAASDTPANSRRVGFGEWA